MEQEEHDSDSQILSFDEAINRVRLKPLHWKIWVLSAMGIWMEGFNLFVIGIALPLLKHEFNPSPLVVGIIAASVIIGTIIGAGTLGRLADIYGRKKILVFNALLVAVFSLLAGTTNNLYCLMIFLCFVGLGVGADYPICASYVAELMPSRIRGKMLIGAFSFQALGMLTAALVGFCVLTIYPNENAWHWMIALGCIPALLICLFRLTVPESPRWCIENGRARDAMRTISKLSYKSKSRIYKIVKKEEKSIKRSQQKALPYSALFSKEYLYKTILASLPWFFMDIATYGIGIFTPTIISTILTMKHGTSLVEQDIFSIGASAFTYIFLILGFGANILLVEKFGRIKLQLLGFLGMAVGLIILGCSTLTTASNSLHLVVLFTGFIIYSFLMNMGPNATTFILPAELFPTKLRATAHGFSASFAKIGAVIGIVLLPISESSIGLLPTILIISATAFLGFIITLIFRIETTGRSLEDLSHQEAARTIFNRKLNAK
ncbi:MAG TPA: MFS transporter [Victivallales bacterium]|nr:MFS transporter [Victivallales bacterium]